MEKPTAAEVKVIFSTTMSDADLGTIIDDAALIVGQCSAVVAADAETQKAIVKYVTAHLASFSGDVVSRKIGDASETYAASTGMDLASSKYGQRALLLEPTGCLARLGRPRPVLKVL